MRPDQIIECDNFPCRDINIDSYIVPSASIDVENIKVLMISEASPEDLKDYFYASNNPFYLQTTLAIFNKAGLNVNSMEDILNLGIYITTAVKCAKRSYSICTETIHNCAELLEKEIKLFPNVEVIILNGDVAIKAFNYIAKRQTGKNIIPNGSTYKIRYNKYYYNNIRVFPSYIITGKNILIEKSKAEMVSDDIWKAMHL